MELWEGGEESATIAAQRTRKEKSRDLVLGSLNFTSTQMSSFGHPISQASPRALMCVPLPAVPALPWPSLSAPSWPCLQPRHSLQRLPLSLSLPHPTHCAGAPLLATVAPWAPLASLACPLALCAPTATSCWLPSLLRTRMAARALAAQQRQAAAAGAAPLSPPSLPAGLGGEGAARQTA